MRILVLAPQPFFVQRGTPIATKMLIETLTEAGHSVDVIVYAEGEDVDIPGASFYRVPQFPGTGNMPPGFSLKKLVSDAVMFPVIAWRLMRNRFDLVLAVEESAFMAMVLGPVFGVPYIYDMDSSIPEQINDKRPLPKWLFQALSKVEGAAARRSIGTITCCKALEELAKDYAPNVPVQTLEDVTMVEPLASCEPPSDVEFDEPVVMYVGNLEQYQGVDILVEGFAKAVHDGLTARLVIIGGTDEHIAKYKSMARSLGVENSVSLLGPRPVEKLGSYLSKAEIVVSPRTQGRNTPMKVYSYLDSGHPLLATRLPTHTQVLDDKIAMLVDADANGIADGMTKLMNDAQLRLDLATAAAERVRSEYSREAYRRKLLSFLEHEIRPRLKKPRGSPAT